MTRPATHRRKRILITLGVLVATASYNPAHGQDLGQLSANQYATDAPKLYDEEGNYRGKLSANRYDPESVSNPYGVGMKIVAGGQEEGDDDAASPADSPKLLSKPLRALKAPTAGTDPSD